MRFALILVLAAALPSTAPAALLAHVSTTVGDITVELQYDKAPQAVANFITLTEGTRAHIDADTGALSHEPYYIGEKFFRVVDDATFKIAQTGSGTGTNSGGPGYTFKDEFDLSLRHVPYVLSMANSGPNSNGSQIFFVGNSTPSHLDDVHTLFGLVPDAASRATIDAIHAAGNDGSSITAITFERTDAAAEAFDEFAQNLPTVTPLEGALEVTPGDSSRFVVSSPLEHGDMLAFTRSEDLATWLPALKNHLGINEDPSAVTSLTLDDASSSRAFYHPVLARHPGAVAPSLTANLSFNLAVTNASLVFAFDETGTAGTVTYTPATGSVVSGTFNYYSGSSSAHEINFIADTNLNPQYFLIKVGCDDQSDGTISGRHNTQSWNGTQWTLFDAGSATIAGLE
ncbi:peptidylprolyl isomerase [Haloferula sargassicola]|uniref:peptidylprolyl isomerase n=1 Tax=Haloferula sargassicola TaxID=490096 RepID=A0ABP9UJG8_9BACT